MPKQIPTQRSRGVLVRYNPDDAGMHYEETNTDYLNEHAHEWEPPVGTARHMHLIYSKQVHWRIVEQGSAVCSIPGRCYRVDIKPARLMCACARPDLALPGHADYCDGVKRPVKLGESDEDD